MGGLKNKNLQILWKIFLEWHVFECMFRLLQKKQLQIRRYEVDIRRGCNCDLQKLLNEKELYREEQIKSNQQRTLVTLS